jgi:8-oxo-dGTP diphosphatase
VFEIKADTDAKRAEWFKINELPQLAFDHKAIIDKAMENLRKSILFEPVGFDLLNEEFTLPQLQNIYLAILNPERDNKKLCDRRNFKKKMDTLGYIEQIQGKTFKETGRKPSNLYRFNKEAYQAAKSRGIHLEFYN